MHVWFFYKRRVIKAIDKSFEHEINARRINEFREIVEFNLNEKSFQVWSNLSKIKLDDDNGINNLLEADIDEIVDFHFFRATSSSVKGAIEKNLLSRCTKNRVISDIIFKIFPEEPRNVNEVFYCHALSILIKIEEQKINVSCLPSWLTKNPDNIHEAICRLIRLCLNNFQDDIERKIILLAAITYKRIFKILTIILPDIKQLANIQHLITRYSSPEFCLEQLLSCPERNIINNRNGLSIFATSNFVSICSVENKFNQYSARQNLQKLWKLEVDLLDETPNYLQLLKESKSFDEVSPIEAYGVIYDNLGHRCLSLIKDSEKWKSYAFDNHKNEIDFIESSAKNNTQLLADKFFFGDIKIFNRIASGYGFEKYGYLL
ncbi:conserved hypothetical protein [Crenothrix polyspora]|uniref:Uncharacterized protein n=1 Tax=Crenothrix polyspora TaxID=360316 RepID=A0A1R4H9S6_9GAMM|nr:conserved hypothetical protein [Crenothrix polyspora]